MKIVLGLSLSVAAFVLGYKLGAHDALNSKAWVEVNIPTGQAALEKYRLGD